MWKRKNNRMPIGSRDLQPAKPMIVIPSYPPQFKEDEPNEPRIEPQTPRPISPPLNVGEILANVTPDIMEQLNDMDIAINTHNGDVINWATNERMKLDELVTRIEEEKALEAQANECKPQKYSYLRRCWRWLRGIKE